MAAQKQMPHQKGPGYGIHPTAEVSPLATVGEGTRIWHQAQIREKVSIGKNCILGKGVYVDHDVRIGDNCKIQNGAMIYSGATLEEGVFVGPGACIANDRYPRAINPDGTLRTESDWRQGTVMVKRGASLGAGSVVVPNSVIGEWAMVAAGAVVVGDVPAHGLVQGVPARLSGFVCCCGHRLKDTEDPDTAWQRIPRRTPWRLQCTSCGEKIMLPADHGRQA